MKSKRGLLYVGLVFVGLGLIGRFVFAPQVQSHSVKSSDSLSAAVRDIEIRPRSIEDIEQEALLSLARDKNADSKEFKQLLAQVYHSIPSMRDDRSVGVILGEIKMVMNERADLFEHGIAFYRKCARSTTLTGSIRSLCLASLIEYGSETDGPQLYKRYPKSVIELARKAISWP